MEKSQSIPISEAKEYLRLVNKYFGFKYQYTERILIYKAINEGSYQITPSVLIDEVEKMFKYNRDFRFQDYQKVLHVLWLNANLNFKVWNAYISTDIQWGKSWKKGHHYADLLRLSRFLREVTTLQPVTLHTAQGSVNLDNADGWLTDLLKNAIDSIPNDLDVDSELSRITYTKTGSRASDEKNGVAYGTYRLFKEEGLIKRRNEHFQWLLWDYLHLLGLEDRERDDNKLASLNSTINRYSGREKKGNGLKNFHFPIIEEIFFE